MKPTLSGLCAMGLVSLAMLTGGCQSQPPRITADSVRADMSPELESIALTAEQRKNRAARAIDTNLRQIHDDWDMIWLLDRPRMFSRMPIPPR